MIRQHLIRVACVCALIALVLAAPCALTGCFGMTQPPQVAAYVNGVAIEEDDVTEFIEDFRGKNAQYETDSAWAEFLKSNGYTSETLRSYVLDTVFIPQELIRQKCAELGIEIGDTDLDDVIRQEKEYYERRYGENSWDSVLASYGYDEESWRENELNRLLEEQLRSMVIDAVAPTEAEVQAQAILDMRLQRLTGLEREKLETEYEALMERIKRYRELLADPHLILLEVKKDLLEIKDKYGDDRRTSISVDEEEIDSDELVQEEDMMVTLTHFGYVKRISPAAYKAQHRGGRGITGLTTREDDFAQHVLVTSTHSHIFFFTDKGKVYTKKCYQLPEAGRQAKGTAIVNLLSLDAGEKITAMIPSSELTKEGYLFFATKNGTIKRTSLAEFANLRQHGLKAIELREDDKLVSVFKTTGSADIMLGTRKGQAIRFRETDVRPMGRAAMGCRGIALREGDEVIAAFPVMSEYILSITEQGYGKRMKADEFRLQNRGGYGLRAAAITDRSGDVAGLECVREGEDLMLVSDENVVIRMKADEISIYGRNAQGVRVMRIGEGAKVVCMARLDGEAEEDEIAGEE